MGALSTRSSAYIVAGTHSGVGKTTVTLTLLRVLPTTKVALPRQAGFPVAIGCDWAPSGTKNLLGELKTTKLVSDHEGGLFTDQELIDAVTRVPASMIGWDSYVGSIERDKAADLLIVESTQGILMLASSPPMNPRLDYRHREPPRDP